MKLKPTSIQQLSVILLATSAILMAVDRPLLKQPPSKESTRSNPFERLDQSERERAAKAGKKLFQRECSACHGWSAEGTRTAPSLVAHALRQTPSGAIFWVLRNEILNTVCHHSLISQTRNAGRS